MRGVRNSVWTSAILTAFVVGGSPISAQSLVPRGSEQPSFDCTKATTDAARLICADGELAKLDAQLANAYRDRMKGLDTAGQTVLRNEQVLWIRKRNNECRLKRRASDTVEQLASAKPCMSTWLSLRIGELGAPAHNQPEGTVSAAAPGQPQTSDNQVGLTSGAYVASGAPCGGASAATFLRFEGNKFSADKWCAEVTGKNGQIVSARLCEGDDTNAESFQIAGPNSFWRRGTQFRFCEEASLPKEWQKRSTEGNLATKSASPSRAGQQPDIASLKPGTYVQTSTPCRDAPFSMREMFDGKMFIVGKSCPFALKGRHGQQLEITNKCEGEGGEGLDAGVKALFIAKSQTEYSVKTDTGITFNFRYCSQAELDGTADGNQKVGRLQTPPDGPLTFDFMGNKLHDRKRSSVGQQAETPDAIYILSKIPTQDQYANLTGFYTGNHMKSDGRRAFGYFLKVPLGVQFMENAVEVVTKKFGNPLSRVNMGLNGPTPRIMLSYGLPEQALRGNAPTIIIESLIPNIANGYAQVPSQPFAIVELYPAVGGVAMEAILVDPGLATRNRAAAIALIQQNENRAKERERQNLPSSRF